MKITKFEFPLSFPYHVSMIRLATLFLSLAAATCFASDGQENDWLLEARLEAHINFLADDLLRGRQPGTEGYDIAAAYVASQFRQMGLQPGGTEGSYVQNVPLRSARLEEGSARMSLERDGVVTEFGFVDEFYMGPNKTHEQSAISAGAVFAGYGIHAPLLDYSDYEGIDVDGKIVVVLAGMPTDFPSEEGAHFSSGREIARNAIERGAVGFDAIKHLFLCRIERRPPRLNMTIYPYLPKAVVATTSARSYMDLLAEPQVEVLV